MLATLCSSFIVTNFAYATTLAEQQLIDAQAAQKKADDAAAAQKKSKTTTPAQKKAADAMKKAQAAVAAEQKAAAEKAAADKIAADKAADAACVKKTGLTCAEEQKAADLKKQEEQKAKNAADPTNLTEGTFDVTKNLTLDNEDQAKKYFSKDPNAPSPIVALVLTFINFAITIMGSIAVILLIVAGFMFMTAQGNSQKLDEAKDIIKYAAIGLLVALLSYVITIFVQSIFSNG